MKNYLVLPRGCVLSHSTFPLTLNSEYLHCFSMLFAFGVWLTSIGYYSKSSDYVTFRQPFWLKGITCPHKFSGSLKGFPGFFRAPLLAVAHIQYTFIVTVYEASYLFFFFISFIGKRGYLFFLFPRACSEQMIPRKSIENAFQDDFWLFWSPRLPSHLVLFNFFALVELIPCIY